MICHVWLFLNEFTSILCKFKSHQSKCSFFPSPFYPSISSPSDTSNLFIRFESISANILVTQIDIECKKKDDDRNRLKIWISISMAARRYWVDPINLQMNWKICRTKSNVPLWWLNYIVCLFGFVSLNFGAWNVVNNPHNSSLYLISLFIPFRFDIFRFPFLCCVNKKSIKIFLHANGHEIWIAKPRARTNTHTHTYTPYFRLLQAMVTITTKPMTKKKERKNARAGECFLVIFPCLTLNINIQIVFHIRWHVDSTKSILA